MAKPRGIGIRSGPNTANRMAPRLYPCGAIAAASSSLKCRQGADRARNGLRPGDARLLAPHQLRPTDGSTLKPRGTLMIYRDTSPLAAPANEKNDWQDWPPNSSPPGGSGTEVTVWLAKWADAPIAKELQPSQRTDHPIPGGKALAPPVEPAVQKPASARRQEGCIGPRCIARAGRRRPVCPLLVDHRPVSCLQPVSCLN